MSVQNKQRGEGEGEGEGKRRLEGAFARLDWELGDAGIFPNVGGRGRGVVPPAHRQY